jgi:hypothetical protein
MRRRVVLLPWLSALLVVAACSTNNMPNPAQPSASGATAATSAVTNSSTLSASIAAPRPLTPTNNAQVKYFDQPVTLVIQNAVVTRSVPVSYNFEVATDSGFTNKIQTKDGVSEGGGGQTSVRLDVLVESRDYWWHARATAGGTTGVFGPTFKFNIGPAVSLNPPAPVGPLSGAQTGVRPTFTVVDCTRTGPVGAITYRFEIADNIAFTPIFVAGTVAEGPSQTSFTPSTDLTTSKTFYWRATATDQSHGIATQPSAVQSFVPTAVATGTTQSDLAAQEGLTLWPGVQPPGTTGHAVLGDGWQVQNLFSFQGIPFVSPTLEELQIFDLMDRGFDPDGAINWMHSNGYPTTGAYFPAVSVIGFPYQYMAFINGRWDLVKRVGA